LNVASGGAHIVRKDGVQQMERLPSWYELYHSSTVQAEFELLRFFYAVRVALAAQS